uniref:Uncharacterized protein n=1 Tax=Anguilla anguilla TaxID=7936 RepID=A0A0E9PW43_ANGAN
MNFRSQKTESSTEEYLAFCYQVFFLPLEETGACANFKLVVKVTCCLASRQTGIPTR